MGLLREGASSMSHGPLLPFDTEPLEELYDFSAGKELGRGEFGVVNSCACRETGERFACKTLEKARLRDSNRIEDLEMELYCMGVLPPHPNLVQLVSVHEDPKQVHLVMDLCSGGDLFDLITKSEKLGEAIAASVIKQAALALNHCHAAGVAHLDVKPENLLVSTSPKFPDSICVKLADFGQAVVLKPGQMAKGLAGSSFYMAPEVVSGKPYSFPADVWSLGVLLYAMISGYLPFWGKDTQATFVAICCKEPNLSSKPWPSISVEAKHLVRWMLHPDPEQRPTMGRVLSHPWLERALRSVSEPSTTPSPLPAPAPRLPPTAPAPASPATHPHSTRAASPAVPVAPSASHQPSPQTSVANPVLRPMPALTQRRHHHHHSPSKSAGHPSQSPSTHPFQSHDKNSQSPSGHSLPRMEDPCSPTHGRRSAGGCNASLTPSCTAVGSPRGSKRACRPRPPPLLIPTDSVIPFQAASSQAPSPSPPAVLAYPVTADPATALWTPLLQLQQEQVVSPVSLPPLPSEDSLVANVLFALASYNWFDDQQQQQCSTSPRNTNFVTPQSTCSTAATMARGV